MRDKNNKNRKVIEEEGILAFGWGLFLSTLRFLCKDTVSVISGTGPEDGQIAYYVNNQTN